MHVIGGSLLSATEMIFESSTLPVDDEKIKSQNDGMYSCMIYYR